MYNLLFGKNGQTDLLLAVIGFKQNDVERFRDVSVEDDGATIAVYTRTGGGNREDYPQVALYRSPLFARTEDDDGDSTYATFYFDTPAEFVRDVAALADPLTHGLRPEFAQHLAKTLRREPTEADKEAAAYEAEAASLARLGGVKANGHTFVPYSDSSARSAMEMAEKNGGKLRSAWGILPLAIRVQRDFQPWPNAKKDAAFMVRVDVGTEWKIDIACWDRWQKLFGAEFPLTLAVMRESVAQHLAKAA